MSKLYSKNKFVQVVGINDSNYSVQPIVNGKQITCRYYRVWKSMLVRCYNHKFQDRDQSYTGCYVCKEWHSFMNFRPWMEKQDWEGKELDKDILVIGNNVYSPEKCIFVSRDINSLLNDKKSSRGEFPIGVCFNKKNKKFISQIDLYGKKTYIGSYKTKEEAHKVYCKSKSEHIYDVALKQEDFRLTKALIKHGDLYRLGKVA